MLLEAFTFGLIPQDLLGGGGGGAGGTGSDTAVSGSSGQLRAEGTPSSSIQPLMPAPHDTSPGSGGVRGQGSTSDPRPLPQRGGALRRPSSVCEDL